MCLESQKNNLVQRRVHIGPPQIQTLFWEHFPNAPLNSSSMGPWPMPWAACCMHTTALWWRTFPWHQASIYLRPSSSSSQISILAEAPSCILAGELLNCATRCCSRFRYKTTVLNLWEMESKGCNYYIVHTIMHKCFEFKPELLKKIKLG